MTETKWTAVELTLPEDVEPESEPAELAGTLLFEHGAEGVETRDQRRPITLVGAFPLGEGDSPEALLAQLADAFAEFGIPVSGMETRAFEPVDWSTQWKEHFHPLQFGRLWVVPSWLERPAGAEHVLWLDPGMAFGTGIHATTALCLERIVELSPVDAVLDVGTGTGILAMGALLLGAPRAIGTENDPEALAVAAENAEKNGLAARLELRDERLEDLGERFPLVVANILANTLTELAPLLAAKVAPGGRLLLSGILDHQASGVVDAYVAAGLRDPTVTARGEWVRIELHLPPAP
jgi:ribosomal protein L11 methyltransferase